MISDQLEHHFRPASLTLTSNSDSALLRRRELILNAALKRRRILAGSELLEVREAM